MLKGIRNNENFEGGETAFENLTIIPKIGNALCFFHKQNIQEKLFGRE